MKIIMLLANQTEIEFESEVALKEGDQVKADRKSKPVSLAKVQYLIENGELCQLALERGYNMDFWN